jgi:threonine aldolase
MFALDNHIQRLAQDHRHAKMLAEVLGYQNYVGSILPVDTNILIFEVLQPYTPQSFVAALKEKNILAYAISPTQVRIVTHLEINESMIDRTIEVFEQL